MHNETTDQLINPSPRKAPAFQRAHPVLESVTVRPSSLLSIEVTKKFGIQYLKTRCTDSASTGFRLSS